MSEEQMIALGGIKTSPKHIQFYRPNFSGLVFFKYKGKYYTDELPLVKIDNMSTLELVYTKHFGGLRLSDHKPKS